MQNIHSAAMLANLRISQWTARKIDKKVAGEVAKNHNVQASVGAYYKSVLPTTDANGERTAIERIKKLVGEARTYHYKMTLPWLDSGARVLSSAAYFDYMQVMQEFKQRFKEVVNDFVYDYPFEREEAKIRLGTLFNEDDYPPLDRVADRFGFLLDILPIPMGADFRCDIGNDEADKIRAEIEKSLVTNASDLADLLPKLNFTGDPALTALGTALKEKLCVYGADELRNNMSARRETYAAALDMKKDMAAFFGSYQKG